MAVSQLPQAPYRQDRKLFPTPLVGDVLFSEVRDCNRSEFPEYGTPHPNTKKWPNHKLIFIKPVDVERNEIFEFVYAADREEQDKYNFAFGYRNLIGNAGGREFRIVTRTYLTPRADFDPQFPAFKEPMPDVPEGTFDGINYVFFDKKQVKSEPEFDSLYVIEERTYVEEAFLDLKLSYSTQKPDVVPDKFRESIPNTTTEEIKEGLAATPILTGDNLSISEDQLNPNVKLVKTTSRSEVTLPVVLPDGELVVNDYGGVVAKRKESLVADGTPADSGFGILESSVTTLGNGQSVKTTIAAPTDGNGNPMFPTTYGAQIDSRYGVPVGYSSTVIPSNSETGGIYNGSDGSFGSVEIQPKDQWHSVRNITFLPTLPQPQVWYGLRRENLPDVLLDVTVIGTERFVAVPTWGRVPDGPLKSRTTRSFTHGPPQDFDPSFNRIYYASEAFQAVVEYISESESESYSVNSSTSNNESESSSNNESTTSSSGTFSNTSSSTSSSTVSSNSSSSSNTSSSNSGSSSSANSSSSSGTSTSSGTTSSSGTNTSNGTTTSNGSSTTNGTTTSNGSSTTNGTSTSNGSSTTNGTSTSNGSSTTNGTSTSNGSSTTNGTSTSNGSSTTNGTSTSNGSSTTNGTSTSNGSSTTTGSSSSSGSSTSTGSSNSTGSTTNNGTSSSYGTSYSSSFVTRSGSTRDQLQTNKDGGYVWRSTPSVSRLTTVDSSNENSTVNSNSNSTSNGTSTGTTTQNGTSTQSGTTNTNGTSNQSGTSQQSGSSNSSGTSQQSGSSTSSGTSQQSGSSTSSGTSQQSGSSSSSGTSQQSGSSSSNGTSQQSGSSTSSGTSQQSGSSTSSGTSQQSGSSTSSGTSSTTGQNSSTGEFSNTSNGESTSNSNGTNSGTSSGTSSSSGTNNSTSNSTSNGSNSSEGVSSSINNSNSSSKNKSNSTSTSTTKTKGSNIFTLSIPKCLRGEINVELPTGQKILVPATSPTSLSGWIEVSRQSEHWRHGVWITEVIEVFV